MDALVSIMVIAFFMTQICKEGEVSVRVCEFVLLCHVPATFELKYEVVVVVSCR